MSFDRGLFFLFLGIGLVACADPPDAAESMGSTVSHEHAGPKLTAGQVAGALRDAGFPEEAVGPMVCTASHESSFFTAAINDDNENGSIDRGLFQVNSIHLGGGTRGCPQTAEELFDVPKNAACAFAIYKRKGLRPWYGYRAHKEECDATAAPESEPLTPTQGPAAPEEPAR